MATNADEVVAETNDAEVTETDLRNLKYADSEVETPQGEDETEEAEETAETDEEAGEETENSDQASEETEDQSEETPTFVKEFPYIKGDTPEEYAKNLEEAYKHSTSEALRLKKEVDKAPNPASPIGETDDEDVDTTTAPDITTSWVNQQMDKEISRAYEKFKADYPQVSDADNYDKFTKEVATFSRTIMETQGRMAEPSELYQKAALSLGWEKQSVPSEKEKLGMAFKQNAASSKTNASGAKIAAKSKVTDAHIATHRQMTGTTKSDAEIRKELEAHIT
jgi:hypothetical protein